MEFDESELLASFDMGNYLELFFKDKALFSKSIQHGPFTAAAALCLAAKAFEGEIGKDIDKFVMEQGQEIEIGYDAFASNSRKQLVLYMAELYSSLAGIGLSLFGYYDLATLSIVLLASTIIYDVKEKLKLKNYVNVCGGPFFSSMYKMLKENRYDEFVVGKLR